MKPENLPHLHRWDFSSWEYTQRELDEVKTNLTPNLLLGRRVRSVQLTQTQVWNCASLTGGTNKI